MIQPVTFLPPPELQEFVASYGIMKIPEGHMEPYFSPPLALSGFIINLGSNSGKVNAKINGREFFTANAVATGQVTSPVYGKLVGEVISILTFFKPTGMHRLFGNDLSELTNSSKTLYDFLDQHEAQDLYDRLAAEGEMKQQVEILNNFFSKRIPSPNEPDKFEEVLDYIHNKKGNVSISEIEETAPFSRKTLERYFKKKVGLSPKVYAQIYQFKCLINFLQNHPGITWSQLANETGYFDHSHMSRYVKEYLKVSPNSMVKLDMQFINYLLNR